MKCLNIFDKQVDAKTAAHNVYVSELKAELLPDIEAGKAKEPALKKVWAQRNEFLAEVASHIYPNGLGQAARYITSLEAMADPVRLLADAFEEYENISYDQINDGTGLARWDLDPNRVGAVRASIRTKLRMANIVGQIERDLAAAKGWLEKEAELIASGQASPPPVLASPAKAREAKVVVDTAHKVLR